MRRIFVAVVLLGQAALPAYCNANEQVNVYEKLAELERELALDEEILQKRQRLSDQQATIEKERLAAGLDPRGVAQATADIETRQLQRRLQLQTEGVAKREKVIAEEEELLRQARERVDQLLHGTDQGPERLRRRGAGRGGTRAPEAEPATSPVRKGGIVAQMDREESTDGLPSDWIATAERYEDVTRRAVATRDSLACSSVQAEVGNFGVEAWRAEPPSGNERRYSAFAHRAMALSGITVACGKQDWNTASDRLAAYGRDFPPLRPKPPGPKTQARKPGAPTPPVPASPEPKAKPTTAFNRNEPDETLEDCLRGCSTRNDNADWPTHRKFCEDDCRSVAGR